LSFIIELKRRNVLRVAAAYVVTAWLVIQVVETILPAFGYGDDAVRVVTIVFGIGLIPALVFAWAFELTPEGLKKEKDVVRSQSITPSTGKKLDRMIMMVLALALGYFAFDKFVLNPQRAVDIAKTAAEAGEQRAREEARLDTFSEKSVAVLPFANRSEKKEDEYFTDGMHDEILTRLSRIASLKVISRTSVMNYRGTDKSIPEIARELSVATILEGGVQRSGNHVRINVQLIDAHTDEHVWADIYDRELTAENLFAVQSDISTSITQALKAKLTPNESLALKKPPTDNLQAYDAYMAGRAKLYSPTKSDVEQAAKQFLSATELDADFAAAWAGLCESHLDLYQKSRNIKHFTIAEAACKSALKLDDSQAEVLVAMALLYSLSGKYSHAEVSLRRADFAKAEQALSQIGNFDDLSIRAQLDLGSVLAHQGRLAEAEATLQKVARVDPRNWQAQTSLFGFYYTESDLPNRFELAAHHASLAAALKPNVALVWNNLGSANYMLAQYDQAADAWQHSLEIEPTRTAYTNTGIALYNARKFVEAAAMQEKAIEMAPNDFRSWGRLGDALRFIPGKDDEAKQAFTTATEFAKKNLEVNDQDWRTWGLLSGYLVNMDHFKDAILAAERALQLAQRNSESLYYAAFVEHVSGNNERTLDLLEEAVIKDPAYRDFIKVDPSFDSLSAHPRFRVLTSDR
jgi:TolB-like protein/tetratricopeptide (TPR) repeat protein